MRISLRIAALFLLILPAISAAQVTIIDTVYTPPGYPGGPLSGTIFIPDQHKGAAVVLLHGGGGNRSDMYTWCDSLAANGFVAMAISYPDLATPNKAYPNPVRAFKTGVEFLRANSGRFGLTTNKIMALGISYGALVVGQGISSDNRDDIIGTNPMIDDAVQGAALFYGAYNLERWLGYDYGWFVEEFFGGDEELAAAGDPIKNVSRITAPVLLAHGTDDVVNDFRQSKELHDSLTAQGKSSRLETYIHGEHMFDFHLTEAGFSAQGLDLENKVVAFFNSLLSGASVNNNDETAGMNPKLSVAPNPASSRATISFCLQAPGDVVFEVADLLGRSVVREEIGSRDAGCDEHSIRVDGLSAGIYYCRVQAGGTSSVVPMIIQED